MASIHNNRKLQQTSSDDSSDSLSSSCSSSDREISIPRRQSCNYKPSQVTTTTSSGTSLTWKIDQFSNITKPLKSSHFSIKEKPQLQLKCNKANNKILPKQTSFYLRMIPRHSFSYRASYYTIFYLRTYEENSVTMQCRFSVIDANGKRCFTQESQTKLARHTSSCNGFFCLSREYILEPESGLLKDGSLTILCEIVPIRGHTESNKHQQLGATSKVLQDYDSLLENAKFSDVVLVVGKGRAKKDFNAHKGILASRSPVFGAMFEHKDTKEAQESKVLITDVVPEVFEQFIRFVYTGKVTEMDKYAQDLLIVADKYQMNCLKTLCSHHLSSQLTTESVSSILVLADFHNAAELKSNCVEYFSDHAEEVMASEDWKLIKAKPELVIELLQNHVKKFKK